MIYLESPDTRSDFNLSLEQYIFDRMPRKEAYFMLWQNSPAVIIGKYQNTWEEVNAAYARSHGIRVTRRLSGGGAVYHDLGNINYTFIVDGTIGSEMNFAVFCEPLIRTLKNFGIEAQLDGRNDITIEGKKFSGNAQYSREGRIMHHGTILYDSDLQVLQEVLRVSEDKIMSKGIKSVHSRVTNIRPYMERPVPTEEFFKLLRRNMCLNKEIKKYELSEADLQEIEKIRQSRYAAWEWNWGRSPACTVRKERRIEDCGSIQIHLDIQDGRIKDCRFFGDFFGEGASGELLGAIKGCILDCDILTKALQPVDVEKCFYHLTGRQLAEILVQ